MIVHRCLEGTIQVRCHDHLRYCKWMVASMLCFAERERTSSPLPFDVEDIPELSLLETSKLFQVLSIQLPCLASVEIGEDDNDVKCQEFLSGYVFVVAEYTLSE